MSASIVCGVDGSADSQDALRVAARLAGRLQLRLVVAHVGEPEFIPYAAAAPFGGMAGRNAVMEVEPTSAERATRYVGAAGGATPDHRSKLAGIDCLPPSFGIGRQK